MWSRLIHELHKRRLARARADNGGHEGRCALPVGKAASSLRGKLGESLASIQKFDTPVTEATTSSLESLKAYAAADVTRNAGGEAESIPGFQRALELDPNFAMAHGRMSAIYTNLGEDDKSLDEAKKAFDLRDRVSERERFYIDDHFYSAIGNVEKNKEVLHLATRAYPNDSSAFGNLALEYNLFYGQYDKAIPIGSECIRLGPLLPLAISTPPCLIWRRTVSRKRVGWSSVRCRTKPTICLFTSCFLTWRS